MEDQGQSSGAATMAPPGFQTASEVYKASNTSGSMRNASGGLPPIPKPPSADVPEVVEGGPTSAVAEGDAGQPAKPVKPINRPATSKNAIVYNAVQVCLGSGCNARIKLMIAPESSVAEYQECGD